MPVDRYKYLGNTNIGFYGTATDTQAILPPDFEQRFDVKTAETYIARTRLVGLFTAGNSECILIPEIATDRERAKLEDAGIEFQVIESNDTALGNLILANDNGAVIGPGLEPQKEVIENALGVETVIAEVAGTPNPGACGFANNQGVLLHRDTTEEEAEIVSEALGVEVDIGTVNMGSPYIGSGIVGNDELLLVGGDTSGPEIGRIDRTLVRH